MEMAAAGRTLFVFAPPTPAADSAGRLLVTAQSACRAFEVNRDLCVLQTSAMMVLEPKISACEGLPDVDSEGESQLRYFSCALDLFRDQPCTVSNTAVQLTSAIAAACGDAPLAANPTVVVPQVTSKLWTSSRKWQTVTVPAGDGISISNYDSYNSPRALQLLFNFSSSLGDVFAIEAAFSNSFLEQGWSVSKRLLDHSAVVVEYSGLGGKRVSAFFMGGSSVGGAGGTPTMLTLKWLSPVDDGVAAGPVAAIVPPQDMAEGLPAASPPGGQTDAMQGSESAAEGSKSETIAETSKSVWLLPPNDTGNWFVLVGTFASGESAAAAISDLAERGWIGVQRPARLHSPTSPGFIVVIGTNLSSDNADALIAEAESQIPGLTKFQRQPAPAR